MACIRKTDVGIVGNTLYSSTKALKTIFWINGYVNNQNCCIFDDIWVPITLCTVMCPYNPSVRITTSLLTPPPMLCLLILYISGWTYSLNSTSNNRFLRSFMVILLFFSQSFCQKYAESSKSPKKYFFIFRFVRNVCPGIGTVALRSNKSIHYLLD